MQSDRPKQYLPLGRSGQTVLQTTVLALLDVSEIDGIYVAVSPEDEYVDTLAIPAAVLRTGGKTRAETVYQTLEALSDTIADDDLVLVHDAARLCATAGRLQLDRPHAKGDRRGDVCRHGSCRTGLGYGQRVDEKSLLVEDVERNG